MTIDFQIGLGRFFCCRRSKSWVATLCNDRPALRWMSSSKRSTSHPRSAGCGLQSPWFVLAQDFIHHWRSMVLPCVTMLHDVTVLFAPGIDLKIGCEFVPRNLQILGPLHPNPKNMRRYEHVCTKHKQTNVQSPSETARIGKGHTATPSTPDAAT